MFVYSCDKICLPQGGAGGEGGGVRAEDFGHHVREGGHHLPDEGGGGG